MNTSNTQSVPSNQNVQQPSGARDNTGLYYSTHIRITDPKTGQVLLQVRGE